MKSQIFDELDVVNIGYFRLTGYMYPLQENDGSHAFCDHWFTAGLTFHYRDIVVLAKKQERLLIKPLNKNRIYEI